MSNKSGSSEGNYNSILRQAQKEKAKIIQRYQAGLINTNAFVNQVNTFNKKYEKSKQHNEINALLFKPDEYQTLITVKLRSDLANAKMEHQILSADLMDDTQAMEAVIREHLNVTKKYLDAGFASKVLLHPDDFSELGLDEKKTMNKINGPKRPAYKAPTAPPSRNAASHDNPLNQPPQFAAPKAPPNTLNAADTVKPKSKDNESNSADSYTSSSASSGSTVVFSFEEITGFDPDE